MFKFIKKVYNIYTIVDNNANALTAILVKLRKEEENFGLGKLTIEEANLINNKRIRKAEQIKEVKENIEEIAGGQ